MSVLTNEEAILKSLKIKYKDGMGSLLGREGSAIKEINFEKAEGKAYNFSAVAGSGGAVAGNFLTAIAKATDKGQQAEFSVEPGAIWSTYTLMKTEIEAGKTNIGAYAPIFNREFFRATSNLRKTLSSAFYGRGYGEIAMTKASITVTANTDFTVTLDPSETQKLEVGREVIFKSTIGDQEENAIVTGTVKSILGGMKGVVITPATGSSGTIPAKSIVCYKGSTVPGTTTPLLPIGLDAWLPIVEARNAAGSVWPGYIATTFCAQNRSSNPDRMAGAFYVPATGTEKKIDSLQNALTLNRAMGGNADMIIVNMFDRAEMAAEVNTQNQYFSGTDNKRSRKVNVGLEDLSVSAATNLVEMIVDDIDCPRGKFYVLTKDTLGMLIWFSKQDQNKDDGIATNEPGKPGVDDVENFDFGDGTSRLNVEDYITVEDGVHTVRGPGVAVTLGFMGALACFDPSANVVGVFANASQDYSTVLGYTA